MLINYNYGYTHCHNTNCKFNRQLRDRVRAGTLVPFGHGTDSKVPPTSGGAVQNEVLKMELSGSVYIKKIHKITGSNSTFVAEIIINHY